jgi:CheY-like chemotaxis protein
MTDPFRKRIYVLEKKPRFRAMRETELPTDEVSVHGFSGHQECLARLATKPCDLLIVDLDVHRKNIMRKLQATGLVDLIKRALEMGFSGGPERRLYEPGPQLRNDAVENVVVGTGAATGA